MWQYKGGCGNIREGVVIGVCLSYISALPCIGCVGVHSGGPSKFLKLFGNVSYMCVNVDTKFKLHI